MAQTLYIRGKPYRLNPADVIGQGGEAVVYRYTDKGQNEALKVYMQPTDPAFANDPVAQMAARVRIEEHQQKLQAFPAQAPGCIIKPAALAYTSNDPKKRRVAGFTMTFLRDLEVLMMYANKKWRRQSGIDRNQAVSVFRNLRQNVLDVHQAHMVIGDFNDLNVMVTKDGKTFLVDADAMQFMHYLCRTFTLRFIDPLHCRSDAITMAKPHSQSSDWYAYGVMLFQSLLFINPYGGIHNPKDGSKPLTDTQRMLKRVTVFAEDIIYPKAAIPFTALPDNMLEYFTELFTKDKREIPAESLLDDLRWTTCTGCGLIHARQVCPVCVGVGVVKQTVTVRGNVTATQLFRTSGQILQAAYQGGSLYYVYHESGTYKREGGRTVTVGDLDRDLRIRIWGNKTVLAKGTSIVALGPTGVPSTYETQTVGRLPVFDTNSQHLYWLNGDRLVHDASLGTITIGTVLPNRTLLWVGERFGFGFFRAGSLTRGLVFGAERPGINDSVPLPPMTGNLIDATCVFANHRAWFMVTIEKDGAIHNHCYVISDKAELLAHAEAPQGDGSWLGENIRGRMAQGEWLFATTDRGIVRIETDGSQLVVGLDYPDTEPFVDATTQLLPDKEGIVAVSYNDIVLLQIR